MNLTLPVESVSETAFLTARFRAIETERPDAHFHDPYARELAGTRGEQLVQRFPGGESTASGCIIRTCLMDGLILRTIEEAAIDTVVNLGAGLDTRPYRLPLAPSLRWFEVDNASVLAYKATKLRRYCPATTLESIPLDVTDSESRKSLFHRISSAAERVLVLTEGLLIYMTREQVASLARDLHARQEFKWWLCDLTSPAAFQMLQRILGNQPGTAEVRLQFAPEEGLEFFKRHGWECLECCSCVEEGRRMQRSFLPDSWSAKLSKEQWDVLRRLTEVVKLKRVDLPKNS